jgi:hypothetical protein
MDWLAFCNNWDVKYKAMEDAMEPEISNEDFEKAKDSLWRDKKYLQWRNRYSLSRPGVNL